MLSSIIGKFSVNPNLPCRYS